MKWLRKLFKKKKTLRDKLIEMYGVEAGVYYDKINQGIPIGGLLETIVFLNMVEEAKKLLLMTVDDNGNVYTVRKGSTK